MEGKPGGGVEEAPREDEQKKKNGSKERTYWRKPGRDSSAFNPKTGSEKMWEKR